MPEGQSGGVMPMLIMIALMFGVLYLLILRPQQKKEKERRHMLDQVKKGDRIITIGGVHGEVKSVSDKTVIISVDKENGITLKLSRAAISEILIGGETEETGKM